MKFCAIKARTERRASLASPTPPAPPAPPARHRKRRAPTMIEVDVRPKRACLWPNPPSAKKLIPVYSEPETDSITGSLNDVGELGDVDEDLSETDDSEKTDLWPPENWKRHVLSLSLEIYIVQLLIGRFSSSSPPAVTSTSAKLTKTTSPTDSTLQGSIRRYSTTSMR